MAADENSEMMFSQPERQHRIGLLLEYSGGTLVVVALGLHIARLTVDHGSSLHQTGRRVAAVALLFGGLALLLGLAIDIVIHRRGLAMAIAGTGVALPAAFSISTIYLGLWNVQGGRDLSQELLALYGVGVGFVVLSLVFSVWKTTESIPEGESTPSNLNRKVGRLAEQTNELYSDSLRARKARYQVLATALAGIGTGVMFFGILLGAREMSPVIPSQTVAVLGGIGLFTGVFIYFLTPERFVTATVVTAVCRTLDSVSQSLLEEVSTPVYAYAAGNGTDAEVYLKFSPNPVSLDGGETTGEPHPVRSTHRAESSLAQIVPTGLSLYHEVGPIPRYSEGSTWERSLRLAETLNSPLGLVDDVDATWESDQLSVRIANSTCGPLDRFDHPVPSLLGCGLAIETESAVVVETDRLETPEFDWQVVCRQAGDRSAADEPDR